ncbi:hypothetical protein CMQ_206 [Grosmannia clavigera kw1407]|uniref:DUF7719 domain-containing protein n=1 Tax=Grosmannia clavigera (strain kw1407 / UAMH 11150) TaxID=655863 RepID=F0XR21_GROCL|nr:uncharacterized protein CMQ_206 [Grosmannia clavigera kw1407]EFW99888.1 hypothetical protein CMQ_206 [Grosmannia clavigera kw1407]
MSKKASRKSASTGFELHQPDRSGPSEPTLLQMAGERNLFKQAERRQRELDRERGKPVDASSSEDDDDDDDGDISPQAERLLDTLLWCVSLSMLHFTFDVLVQNQYAVQIRWPTVIKRSLFALPVFSLLFYNLHAHPTGSTLLPFLSPRLNARLRTAIFFLSGLVTGCYLIHITNNYSYLAVMKHAPPIGCIWVWSVIEMDLIPAVASLAIVAGFMWLKGYSI